MNRFLGIIILAFFSFSCSSDLDFDQANDLKLEPVVVANLATFDIKANQFVRNGVDQGQVGEVVELDVFKDSFFNKNLNRADFFFEFNNTINRSFKVDLYFLDNNNARLYTIPIDIPAYSGVENLVTKTEIFEKAKLNILKKTTQVAFVITLLSGPTMSESSLGSLKLRSSATIYLVVQ